MSLSLNLGTGTWIRMRLIDMLGLPLLKVLEEQNKHCHSGLIFFQDK